MSKTILAALALAAAVICVVALVSGAPKQGTELRGRFHVIVPPFFIIRPLDPAGFKPSLIKIERQTARKSGCVLLPALPRAFWRFTLCTPGAPLFVAANCFHHPPLTFCPPSVRLWWSRASSSNAWTQSRRTMNRTKWLRYIDHMHTHMTMRIDCLPAWPYDAFLCAM